MDANSTNSLAPTVAMPGLLGWMAAGNARYFNQLAQLGARHAAHLTQTYATAATALGERTARGVAAIQPATAAADFQNWATDAAERSAIMLDTLIERGNETKARAEAGMPPVLTFGYDLIVDGRKLPRPINYSLVQIRPPEGVAVDPAKRPFVMIDPRAGHGAGIGGFKRDSQVGEAFDDGHPVYFTIFSPRPVPGQTMADICSGESVFVRTVAERHPDAKKPAVVGNCQGGWATMLLAATDPDAVGAVAINGAPMAYWAGESGKNPMRYMGGLQGGVMPAMLTADLGGGLFDGAWLVSNFEKLNPANTKWSKYYDLYAKGDAERERFLEFERWWSSFYFMNEVEIRWIVENLFIGNRLAHGTAMLGDQLVDLRKITAPIIVFASKGDNITPVQQALNWIPDLYPSVYDIKAAGQRIAYMVHDSIGHLGIFVSGKIANREHDAITDVIAAIEALPPGLYEMVLVDGDDRLHVKLEPRTIDDIMAYDDGRDDEQMFATVDRLSELGAQAYATFGRPLVRAMVTPESAEAMFKQQPLRAQRAMLSDENPLAPAVHRAAAQARANPHPVAPDNPFWVLQTIWADSVETGWNLFRDGRDAMMELGFQTLYGAPAVRLLGDDDLYLTRPSAMTDPRLRPEIAAALAKVTTGGVTAAAARILLLLGKARGEIRRTKLARVLEILERNPTFATLDATARAELLQTQPLIVEFEPEAALDALPALLPTAADRDAAMAIVDSVIGKPGMTPPERAMYDRIDALLRPAAVAAPMPVDAVAAPAAVDMPPPADLPVTQSPVRSVPVAVEAAADAPVTAPAPRPARSPKRPEAAE